jgi:predicted permease
MRLPWVRRGRRDAELDEEVRSHLAMDIAQRVARGERADVAARAARREFGNVAHVKEVTRETWGSLQTERLAQDVHYAVRALRRSPAFSVVAILTLALGIGVNTAVFTVVNTVLLRPLPFPESQRLALVSYDYPSPFLAYPGLVDAHYLEYRRAAKAFDGLASFNQVDVALTNAGDPVRLRGANITPELTRVLRVPPVIGRGFLPSDAGPGAQPVVIIGDGLWHERFGGDSRIVGQTIMLERRPHRVIGIMPRGFDFPYDAQLWLPLEVQLDPHNSSIRPVVGRLAAGVSRQQALAELASVVSHLPIRPGEKREAFRANVRPLAFMIVGAVQRPLWVFAGAVGFVLLIACANVANLLLMRATARQQELAVRAALGAGRPRLIRQLLTESVTIALLGSALGVLLATMAVTLFIRAAPAGRIPRVGEIHVDMAALAFTLGLALVTGLLFGTVPALRSTRRDLRASLSSGTRSAPGGHGRLRGSLVVSEIALALVLLAGAGLMTRSVLHMRRVDLGFRPDHVVSMTIDLPEASYPTGASMQEFHRRVLERLSATPSASAAGAVNWRPLGGALVSGDFKIEGAEPIPSRLNVDKPSVSPGYFAAMGIRLVRGRDFTMRDDERAPGVVVVSESVANRYWPDENPLGKRISMKDDPTPQDWLTIVGVVNDVVQKNVTTPAAPAIYQPYLQVSHPFFLGHMTFAVRTSADPLAAVTAMRDIVRAVDANQPIGAIATMNALVAETTAESLFQTRLLAVFSVLAVVLAAIGVYGVLAYGVSERTREIGIRIALGGTAGDVQSMVLGRTLRLAVLGVLIGLAGAVLGTRVLTKLLFGVKPGDPLTFGVVAALLVIVAIVAGIVPARRASRVDPLVALRAE